MNLLTRTILLDYHIAKKKKKPKIIKKNLSREAQKIRVMLEITFLFHNIVALVFTQPLNFIFYF
jgi:hypothetical protein